MLYSQVFTCLLRILTNQCLTVYSGTCISLSLQIPKSRNKECGVFGVQWFLWITSNSWFLWKWVVGFISQGYCYINRTPLPPQPLSTIVFSLSRLKAHMEALTSKAIHIQQGLSVRLTVPKPLSWRSDFISWRHQQPFMIFLGLIPVRANSIHPDSSLQPLLA